MTDPLYYRIIVDENHKLKIVEMQYNDERDYNQEQFFNKEKYNTKHDAQYEIWRVKELLNL